MPAGSISASLEVSFLAAILTGLVHGEIRASIDMMYGLTTAVDTCEKTVFLKITLTVEWQAGAVDSRHAVRQSYCRTKPDRTTDRTVPLSIGHAPLAVVAVRNYCPDAAFPRLSATLQLYRAGQLN